MFRLKPILSFFTAMVLLFSQDILSASVSKKEFDEVVRRIKNIYAPKALDRGRILEITSLWEHEHEGFTAVYGASTNTKWQIYIYNGGYTKTFSETMTIDTVALLVCHEIGHYFGGPPRETQYVISQLQRDQGIQPWVPLSSEGQADYFATWKCLKECFKGDDNQSVMASKKISPIVQKKCEEAYPNVQESLICQRSNMAAFSYMQTIIAKAKRKGEVLPPVSFETPDPHFVSETLLNWYPDLQCRLDTFFQGSLCRREHPCENGIGARPRCWYTPAHVTGAQQRP